MRSEGTSCILTSQAMIIESDKKQGRVENKRQRSD